MFGFSGRSRIARTRPEKNGTEEVGLRMKAILFRAFGGPEVIAEAELPSPAICAGDDILIDVAAASIIPGDVKLRAGALRHLFPVSLPKVPGRDGAGIVRATGPDVRSIAVGDRVCFFAAHAESGCQAAQIVRPQRAVVKLPDGLSFTDAAALTHAGICAWLAIRETLAVGPGETVLVQGGAGAIGGLAVQLAALAGARVLATCRAANAALVRDLGAARVFAYDREDVTAEILRSEGPVDAVLDLVGGPVHAASCRVLRRGGRLAWLIAAPFEDVSAAHGVEARQVAVRDDRAVLQAVIDLAGAGELSPLVAGTVTPGAVAEAHRRIEAGEVTRGRLVLTFPAPITSNSNESDQT